MFNWLRRRITDRQRRIFKFYDGARVRAVDPLLMWRKIMTHPTFNPETHGPAFDRGDVEAYQIVLQCTRDVFEIPVFTEVGKPGLTEQELVIVFKNFLAYCDDLKKSISQSPTLPEDTLPPMPSSAPTDTPTSVTPVLPSMPSDNHSEYVGCC